jgi:hypothetical protein
MQRRYPVCAIGPSRAGWHNALRAALYPAARSGARRPWPVAAAAGVRNGDARRAEGGAVAPG